MTGWGCSALLLGLLRYRRTASLRQDSRRPPKCQNRIESIAWLSVEWGRRWLSAPGVRQATLVACVLLIALAIRLLRLDSLPGEMWGDVTEHYALAADVAAGRPFLDYRFGADGPMFSYLAALVGLFAGPTFYSLKLTTALVGTLVVLSTYWLAGEMFHRRDVALIAGFLTAVSFWSVTFSRQAKPYILVPLFVTLSLYFALKGRRIPAGICLGLGMYTQAAFWGTPLVFLLADPLTLAAGAVVAAPEIYSFVRSPSLFSSGGYIGEKLVPGGHGGLLGLVQRVVENGWKNALSFNVAGDRTFRHNIVGHPSLDLITGVFFLLGLAMLCAHVVKYRDRRLLVWFLVPFVVIQIPSLLDSHPESVPSMARTVGVFPFAFMAAAYGIAQTAHFLRVADGGWKRLGRPVSTAFLGVALAAILARNYHNYFDVYPRGLPNGNTPFDRIIADTINSYPSGAWSALIGCCWGDWGQPEPNAVWDERMSSHQLALVPGGQALLPTLRAQLTGSTVHRRLVLFVNPAERYLVQAQLSFLHLRSEYMLTRNGWNVAWVFDGTIDG